MNPRLPFSLSLLLALLCSACGGGGVAPRSAPAPRSASVPAANISYSSIGQRVWQNECAGSQAGLVSWNAGEDFPSLGIGHFIWFPSGLSSPFEESFPSFVRYARQQGVSVPSYFNGAAPWANRRAYQQDRSGRADAMRRWLAANIDIQSRFLVLRMRQSLPRIVRASSNPQLIGQRVMGLLATTQGNYCLIDYVNFKGEGLKASERYQGEGWGLLQVLEEMRGTPKGSAATVEFARAAAAVMTRRVRNAPASRGESRWLPGWLNRCARYK